MIRASGGDFIGATVDVDDAGARSFVAVRIRGIDGTTRVCVLDENHAGALVLALQSAIAEVQARAVSL